MKLNEQEKFDLKSKIQVLNCENNDGEKTMHENEMECFWEKRKLEVCVWGVILTTSNFCFQLLNVFNPRTV